MTHYYYFDSLTFAPHRLVRKGNNDKPPSPEAQKPKEESIQQIYEALVREKSGLEGRRGELGVAMWQKMEDQPQLFSPQLLKTIASSPRLMEDVNIRSGVAKHRNTPMDIILKLSNDQQASVLASIAIMNPNPAISTTLKIQLLTKMAKGEDYSGRLWAAENPLTPKDLLTKLANDTEKWVREGAQNTLKKLQG